VDFWNPRRRASSYQRWYCEKQGRTKKKEENRTLGQPAFPKAKNLEKGEGRKEKGERRKKKGERRKEKEERRKEK
jgi:hypothetical protein